MPPGGAESSSRASGSGLSLDASVTRYKSVSGFPSGGFFAPMGEGGRLAPRANSINNQELKERMQSLEAHGDEHEKLRERIKNLEESLQRLGRESLERAKLGMEKLAEKYFPKVRTAGPMPHTTPGLVLPGGATAGVAQVRSAYPISMPGVQPMPLNVTSSTVPALATTAMPMAAEAMVLAGGIATL